MDLFDLGLIADAQMMLKSPASRRKALRLGATGLASALLASSVEVTTRAASRASAGKGFLPLISAGSSNVSTLCPAEIPSETAGPYPADGSNASGQQLNALTKSGIVRRDLRGSLVTGNVAGGIPLTIELTLVNAAGSCVYLANHAVYLWHCTAGGKYSLYSGGVTAEDYLRGVQVASSNGRLSFQTIFPGCYAGRWPHMHFEVYASLASATSAANVLHTTQLALPESTCRSVYASGGLYAGSTQNLNGTSLSTDNVFRDGSSLQVATVTGDNTFGYVASLVVGIA